MAVGLIKSYSFYKADMNLVKTRRINGDRMDGGINQKFQTHPIYNSAFGIKDRTEILVKKTAQNVGIET